MTQARNRVLIRVIGAPLLLAALGTILWLDHRSGATAAYGLRVLLTVLGFVGAREFYALCRMKSVEPASTAGALATASIFFPWAWLVKATGYPGLIAAVQQVHWWLPGLLLVYVLLKLVLRFGTFTPEGAAMTVVGFLYIGLLGRLMVMEGDGNLMLWYLVFLVATNKGSDMAAYVTGKLIGRRKLIPSVSPNKTWEGAWGGAIAGTVLGSVVLLETDLRTSVYLHAVPWAILPFYALLVTIAAQFGDLVESAFKRWAGAKDSGRFLPEFGGILDMMDSFLISVPVAAWIQFGLYDLFSRAKEIHGT